MKRHTHFTLIALILSACSTGDGERGCLAGRCPDNEVPIPKLEESSTFQCGLVSDSTTVNSGEVYGITLTAQGVFVPPLTIIQGFDYNVESFAQSIRLFGSATNATSASIVRNGGVSIIDATSQMASCSVSVEVLPASSSSGSESNSSGLACELKLNNVRAPNPGEIAIFSMKATGGNGSFTFTKFSPLEGLTLDDKYIYSRTTGTALTSFIYTNRAVRMASVTVKSGTDTATCRTPVFVGQGGLPGGWDPNWPWRRLPPWWPPYPTPTPSPTPSPSNSCDIKLSPSPVAAGMISQMKVTPVSSAGTGPFEITRITATNLEKNRASLIDVLPSLNSAALERRIRVRDGALHRIRIEYKNTASSATGACEAYHQVNRARMFATSTDARTGDGFAPVRTYLGKEAATGPAYQVLKSRVAIGDVNGDGVSDLAIVTGKDGTIAARLLVYSGSNPSQIIFDFDPVGAVTGALSIAIGDINSDGKGDIIVGEESGKTVKVFNGASTSSPPSVIRNFSAHSTNVGVRLASGDFDKDGYSDIAVAPVTGKNKVLLFSGKAVVDNASPTPVSSLFALSAAQTVETTSKSGVFVAMGDLDNDGKSDLILSLDKQLDDDSLYKPEVWGYKGESLSSTPVAFSEKRVAYEGMYYAGVLVGAGDLNGDGIAEIITAPGSTMNVQMCPMCMGYYNPEVRMGSLSSLESTSGFGSIGTGYTSVAAGSGGL